MDTGIKFIITDEALIAINAFMIPRKRPKLLRIKIKSGTSYADFKYCIECVECETINDLCFIYDDIYIIIDDKSAQLLNGSVLHWRETTKEKGLKIINPNTKSTMV